MLQYIKDSIFGSRLFHRPNSVEVNSKRKQSLPKKKPLSFDSKQKEKEALMTSKRYQHPEVIVLDDTATIKKYSYSKDYKDYPENKDINQDFAVISDVDDDRQPAANAKSLLQNDSDQLGKQCSKESVHFEDEQAIHSASISKEAGFMKSSILPQSKGKILVLRERSALKVRKVGEKCVICQKGLKVGDSLQLACSHRYHKDCGMQMQWRMRYKCDVCEVKRDHKRCSIVLSMKRRTRQF